MYFGLLYLKPKCRLCFWKSSPVSKNPAVLLGCLRMQKYLEQRGGKNHSFWRSFGKRHDNCTLAGNCRNPLPFTSEIRAGKLLILVTLPYRSEGATWVPCPYSDSSCQRGIHTLKNAFCLLLLPKDSLFSLFALRVWRHQDTEVGAGLSKFTLHKLWWQEKLTSCCEWSSRGKHGPAPYVLLPSLHCLSNPPCDHQILLLSLISKSNGERDWSK